MRTVPAAAALVVLVVVPATAAPPSCRMLRDAKGDAEITMGWPTRTDNDPALDVLSVDIASDDRVVTGVLRVLDLGDPGRDSTFGTKYLVVFRTGATRKREYFGLSASRSALDGTVRARMSWMQKGPGVGATAVFDEDRSEVRITAPVAGLRPYVEVRAGMVFDYVEFSSRSYHEFPVVEHSGGGSIEADEGWAATAYRHGAPSCVRPGT